MATILRRERKDYGGEEVWVEGDDTPVYAAPHVKVTDLWLDGVIAARVVFQAHGLDGGVEMTILVIRRRQFGR